MVCTRLRAKFRDRTTRHFGGDRGLRQNKEFLKYLVWQIFSRDIRTDTRIDGRGATLNATLNLGGRYNKLLRM